MLLLLYILSALCDLSLSSIEYSLTPLPSGDSYIRRGLKTQIVFSIYASDIPSTPKNLFDVTFKIGDEGVIQTATQASASDPLTFVADVFLHGQYIDLIVTAAVKPHARLPPGYTRPEPVATTFPLITTIPFTQVSTTKFESYPLTNFVLDGDMLLAYEEASAHPSLLFTARDLQTYSEVELENIRAASVSDGELLAAVDGDAALTWISYDADAGELTANPPMDLDFGIHAPTDPSQVVVSARTAVTAAPDMTASLKTDAGGVLVSTLQNGAWRPSQLLTSPRPREGEQLGAFLSAQGNIIAASSTINKVYIFERKDTRKPFTLAKTISFYGSDLPDTESVPAVATDGSFVAVLVPETDTPNVIDIYRSVPRVGWALVDRLAFEAPVDDFQLRDGVLFVVLSTRTSALAFSTDSHDNRWKQILRVNTTEEIGAIETDGVRACVYHNSSDITCMDSSVDGPAYATADLWLVVHNPTLVFQVFLNTVGNETWVGNFFFKRYLMRILGSVYFISFEDMSLYPCNMTEDPFEFFPDISFPGGSARGSPMVVFNHTVQDWVLNNFTLHDITATKYSDTDAAYVEIPRTHVVGEDVSVSMSVETVEEWPFCFYTPGTPPRKAALVGDEFHIDLGPAALPSSNNERTKVCVSNWVGADGGDYCYFPNNDARTIIGEVYPFVFPTATTSASGVTTLKIGFINENYYPVTFGLSSLSVGTSEIDVATCDGGICPFSLPGPDSATDFRLSVEATFDFLGDTDDYVVDVSRELEVHLGVRPAQKAAQQTSTSVRFSLFNRDGAPVSDATRFQIFSNGVEV
eukprot:gnl/Chilomastix_cuspidata/3036.p1 GENE.gnl/Chilomastix_cuspidata/3036~~gnl/Chilomastix_cuspidata/3036.p1  ORF type:complete len:809 (-),score=253.52 gnl/Chilomastix_cuspidata/3036:170-2596(-)